MVLAIFATSMALFSFAIIARYELPVKAVLRNSVIYTLLYFPKNLVVVGMIAGYFGGIIDSILMRLVDVFCAVPWIIMVTVVSLLFKKGLASIVIVIGCFGWMEISRLVRTETMAAKNRDYVHYAELIGVPKWKIMLL